MKDLFFVLAVLIAIAACACTVDLGTDHSIECARGEFCIPVRYLGVDGDGDAQTTRDCRECDVATGGGQPGDGVYDPLNVCNCDAGEFCRQTSASFDTQASVVGYCEPSTLVGMNCSTNDDCEGEREHSLDGGYARAERAYCHRGACRQCNPDEFSAAYGSSSIVCLGYVLYPNGIRKYLTARPGTVVTCTAGGDLLSSGAVDWELMHSKAVVPTNGEGSEREPEYVAGLLATNFVMLVLLMGCICFIGFVVTVVYIRGQTRVSRPDDMGRLNDN